MDMRTREPGYSTFGSDKKDPGDEKTYKVVDAVDTFGIGRYQVAVILTLGLVIMADSMELMVLTILPPELNCEWNLSVWQQALLNMTVFLGTLAGGPLLGLLADRHGRRTVLLIGSSFGAFFGLLSAASPTFAWILFLRIVMGVWLGAIPVAITYTAELSPTTSRGRVVSIVWVFWMFGAMTEVVLAILLMRSQGWRAWLAASAMPMFCAALIFIWFPESPRFSAQNGNMEEAFAALEKIKTFNRTELPPGKLVPHKEEETASFSELFLLKYRKSTLLILVGWFTMGFSYYGIAILTTELVRIGGTCLDMSDSWSWLSENEVCNLQCVRLDTPQYLDILYTTSAEIIGYAAALILADLIGRKFTLCISLLVFTCGVLPLGFCLARIPMLILLIVARAGITTFYVLIYLYTAEVYPTRLRSLGQGTGLAVSRIGTLLSPLVAQVVFHSSGTAAVMIYASLAFVTAIACFFLPVETKGITLEAIQEVLDKRT